jgi:DNA-binding GntR family transcriptional regulator
MIANLDLPALVDFRNPIGFVGVKQGLYDYLRLQIIVGNIVPGRRLNETELASRFNISRAPLREAFRLLENENLVTSFPRKGCYVTHLSLDHCREICEIREMIECFAIDLFERNGLPDLTALAQLVEKTAKAEIPSSEDAQERFDYLKMVLDFHIRLVKATGNALLFRIYEGIFTALARYRSVYRPTAGMAVRSQREHNRVLDLISKKHFSQAKGLLTSHLQLAFDQMSKNITRRNSR